MKKQFSKLLFPAASQSDDEVSSQNTIKASVSLFCKRRFIKFKVRAEVGTEVYHRGGRILLSAYFLFAFLSFAL